MVLDYLKVVIGVRFFLKIFEEPTQFILRRRNQLVELGDVASTEGCEGCEELECTMVNVCIKTFAKIPY